MHGPVHAELFPAHAGMTRRPSPPKLLSVCRFALGEDMQQPRRTSHGVAERQLWALKGRGVCAQTGAAAVSHRAGSCWATHSQGGWI